MKIDHAKSIREHGWTVIGEALTHVDATPDEKYVLRILRAHLSNNETCTMTDNTNGDPPTNPALIALNEASAKRVKLLRAAIHKLENDRERRNKK